MQRVRELLDSSWRIQDLIREARCASAPQVALPMLAKSGLFRLRSATARIVFEAWTTPELFKRWWGPKSCGATLLSIYGVLR